MVDSIKEGKRSFKVWEIVGKISLVVLLIVALFQLRSFILSGSSVKSKAYYNEYEYHPAPFVNTYIDTLREHAKMIKSTHLLYYFEKQQYYSELTLTNVDKYELSDLIFNLSTEGFYEAFINEKLVDGGDFSKQINIGNLRTKQKLKIRMWHIHKIYGYKNKLENLSLSTKDTSIKVIRYWNNPGRIGYYVKHKSMFVAETFITIGIFALLFLIFSPIINKIINRKAE